MTITPDGLLASAKTFADRSLSAYVKEDTVFILPQAATSLEHLSKALLCSRSPVLLMDIQRGKLDSLVQLAGFPEMARKPQEGPYTISGTEAIKRVESLWPAAIKVPKEIERLIAVRNMTLHIGEHQKDDVREIFSAYLRLADKLFTELKVPDTEKWGKHADLVDSLISRSLSEIERNVKQRMAAAKLRINALLAGIPESQRRSVMNARQAQVKISLINGQETAEAECPVCEHPDAVYIGLEDFDVDVDVEPDGMGGYTATTLGGHRFLAAHSFHCGVCELDLVNAEELDAAGLETNIDLSEFDEPDFDPYDR
ncbi:hypothetical protein [Actinomadura sp. RB99]|uniref:hypothetical protein n=1 Tax=Actinomadura sp. RB99 TaxID=2691577 RepID=UPI0016825900|nr:hypothetical protein [Actinomadura sp. RB99]